VSPFHDFEPAQEGLYCALWLAPFPDHAHTYAGFELAGTLPRIQSNFDLTPYEVVAAAKAQLTMSREKTS
jgi:hypothetical protein